MTTVIRALLALGVALGIAMTAPVARAEGPPVIGVANRRFDHDRHAASASAAGKTAACGACHDDRPKTQHARCAGCHVFPNSCSAMALPGPASPARLCRTCHVSTRADCLPKDLPPLPPAGSFTSRFTHAKHLAIGPSIERDCGVCHAKQVATPPTQKPHALCSGCHNPNGTRPSMTECAACHTTQGKPAPASAASDPFRIPGFDHKEHAKASRTSACLGCHDKVVDDVPRTTMLGCQTRCHDGQKAFSATGTHCTLCHKGSSPAPAMRTDLPFSHAEHKKRNVKMEDCATCHVLDNDGTLAAPLSRKDHLPCANAACHQSEFAARAPKICGVCHDSAAPWAKIAARPTRRRGLEWFEAMNHSLHLGSGRTATCETCHGDKRSGAEAPHDHRACVGCHAHGAQPLMVNCAGCHSATGHSKVTASEWNVAALFEHTRHAVDPRSHKPTACTECHTKVATAKDMSVVTAPRMADCDGCHDGKIAFKTTGFGCVRCHGQKPPATAFDPRGARAPAAASVPAGAAPGAVLAASREARR
ncbi:MAG TPA: cytochrome c3 family protein [Kofleriaceae bacterium]|nr:cytochrome c3 family protein [Kofleriaceae bacterium]